ncbi:30S ribosomal protein S15 [Archaeoglobus veneficus]|uniref:Small ribosomal subunit protein uS15 n=1 Tax=Archaeoglobus veneficus (strain DSM 11195 / SNP6) TaxID=693661 RepID=F2KPJ5_ARCVS|nr:30S ribosomal protein S15 [Archaeoglobus veneficus]AEA46426.1 Ribosomal S13S15 domain protein [Archaeoglobus veneficus SNP6]
MARMHARRRGSSGSKRVYRDGPPEWVEMSAEEVEKKIIELYNEGYEPSMIGMILRDRYGIPSVRQVTGKKIQQILKEKGAEITLPEDLKALIKKAIKLRQHVAVHRKDYHNIRGLQLIEAKIWRLSNYYKEKGVLPANWKYDPEKLRIALTK